MKKFVCPMCSEVTISAYEKITCPVCGMDMARITDSLSVRLPDRPGALADFTQKIAEKGINIESLRVLGKENGEVLLIFSVDRKDEALTIPGVSWADEVSIPFRRSPETVQE